MRTLKYQPPLATANLFKGGGGADDGHHLKQPKTLLSQ